MVTRQEAAALAAGNPLSFLHVVRSDIDLPPETDPHAPAIYAKAKHNLDLLMQEGTLVREATPILFVYELTAGRRNQVGVVGCVHVDDYANNVIRKHENTRKDKEDDRTRHILTLNAQAEPVFLAYEASPFIGQLNHKVMDDATPLFDFTAEEIRHRVWRVRDPSPYVDGFRRIANAHVADGHHRSAGAWRAAIERRGSSAPSGSDEADWFLAVLFPSNQLRILPYHRVVRDLNGMTPDAFLARLAAIGTVAPTDSPLPERAGSFGVLVGGRWHRLALDPGSIDRIDPIRSLDASLLQSRVLEPMLAIGDVRSDARIGFVGGGPGIAELERQVTAGEMALAFAMYPVSMEQLMRISDAGVMMPPKTTWFEPKLRSGLFVHSLD